MERLTFEGNFCDIAQCRELPCKYGGNCSQKQVWERLREYEDTGLSPQACTEAREIEETLSGCDYSISRMVKLMNADKDGRVVILPCKVGDTIYVIAQVLRDDGVHSEISPIQITGIGGNTLNKVWLVSMVNRHEIRISPSEFGKTVFRTREEAEKTLQEMKGETET